jgi:biotin carboxylase
MNTLNKPWLVVIPAGRWQIKGIQVALDCGMNVLAFDSDPKALGLSVATKSIIINVRDSKAVLAAINSSGIFPEGVINFASEVGMSTAAEIRKKYRLTGPNINLTKLLTDKSKQRRIWQKHGVPNPNWRVFSDVNHVLKIVQHIGYPCIIKPVDNAGSRGVTKVENINDLINAANSALRFSKQGLALIEAFMEGTEYTVETFGNGINNYVLAVTKKKKVSVTKGTVAIELSTASDIKKEKIVSDSAISALNALGYNYGPGHTEVIIDKNNKPGLVEAAGRGGGFMVFERMVQSISGFDIVTATILQ